MTKYKLLFFILFLGITINIYSQTNYFNKQIKLPNTWSLATSIIRNDYDYVTINRLGDTNNIYHNQISFMKFDLQGNIIYNKIYSDSFYNSFSGLNGSLHKINNGYILGIQKRTIFGDSSKICLIKFDVNGDTLWTKDFQDTYFNRNYLFDVMASPTIDSGFILTGQICTGEFSTKVFLIKTDSLGIELWRKYYGYSTNNLSQNSVNKILTTYDSGFLIFGCANNTNSVNPIVIKTDSIGNQQWIKYYGNGINEYNRFGSIVITQDSNFIFAFGQDTTTMQSAPIDYLRIIKIDKNGTEIWNKSYLQPRYQFFVNNMIITQAGNIVAVGNTYNSAINTFEQFGWIMKFNENGDSLWYHQYRNYWNSRYIPHNLFDVKQTTDGGLIACGEIQDLEGSFDDIWLLKMDSNGCINSGCTTGIEVEDGNFTPTKLRIFPNPATNEINLEFDKSIQNEEKQVFIYDSMGRLLKLLQLNKDEIEPSISVQDLENGIYFIKVILNNKEEISNKFLKL